VFGTHPVPPHPLRVGGTDRAGNLVLLAIGVAACGLLLRSRGTSDVAIWEGWVARTRELGLTTTYARIRTPWPPGAISVLRLFDALGSGDAFFTVKVAITTFLAGTAFVVAMWMREVAGATIAITAIAINSVGLGYLDVLFALPLLLSLWALQRDRLAAFSALFATACLIKPQPVTIAPFIVIFLAYRITTRTSRIDGRKLAAATLPALAVASAFGAAFGPYPIGRACWRAISSPYVSGNALNLNWILGAVDHGVIATGRELDPLYISQVHVWIPIVARLTFAVATIVILYAFWRGSRTFEQLIGASIAGALAYFAFNTGVHENHLFLACILSVVGLWFLPRYRIEMIIVIMITQVNLVAFYGLTGTLGSSRVFAQVDVTIPLALVVWLACLFVITRMLRFVARSVSPRNVPELPLHG
jgi:hypothetical protein